MTRDDSPDDGDVKAPGSTTEEATRSRDERGGDWRRGAESDTLSERDSEPLSTATDEPRVPATKEHAMAEDTPDPPARAELAREDLLMVVLSVFVPGLGHLLQGFTKRGLLILGASVMTCCTLGVLNVGSAFDLYCISLTKKYRQIGEWEFFPDMERHLKA
jgi:hypothetical protein